MENEKVAFNEMFETLREKLSRRDPADVAEKAGVQWDAAAKVWRFETFGRSVELAFPALECTPELEDWHLLTLLQYLLLADGALLDRNPMLFGEQVDGMVRGVGFDRKVEQTMRMQVGKLDQSVVEERCLSLGGAPVKTNADISYEFWFMPRYPVMLKLWFADEDDPASGRLLLAKSCNHYLPVEPSLFVGELIINTLLGR